MGVASPAALVLRARDGDRSAFEHIVRDAYDRTYALAYRIVTDASDAEDATQEAFLRAWEGLPRLRDPERFEAWLTRSLVHACYDLLRRRRTRTSRIHAVGTEATEVGDTSQSVADRERLSRAFAQLSPEQRTVLALHYYRDLPGPRIAELLGLPVGTVASRLHYGTRALRAALDADDRSPKLPRGDAR